MDTESRDHLRQAIIDEIGSLEASTRALKSRLNELVPISRLPFEVLAATFSFLPVFTWNEGSGVLAWIYVAHVCRRWRETALNHPHFWSHINFTKLTPVGMAEILSRTKTVPLHLEVDSYKWNMEHTDCFGKQLEAHISHTRHLRFSGRYLSTVESVVNRLVSPTSSLESLSLTISIYESSYAIPDNLFNCTAPSLTTLELRHCDISWKSPLLKGLRILKIHGLSPKARPELNDWLDALNEMPQIKELYLQSATPVAPLVEPLISRTVMLPSLTYFRIDASAKDCALALAHLLLPTLTRLRVDVESHDQAGEDVLLMIPHVIRNVCVLQDIEPIQSILIGGGRKCTEVGTWTTPGADVKVCVLDTLDDMSHSACFLFVATGDRWNYGVDTAIFDALLTLFPINSVSTLTVRNRTRLSKEFWLRHAPRWPLLEQARLASGAVRAFWEMLAEDAPSGSPRFPSLTKLILHNVTLNALKSYHLCNMLIKRMKQGVPLECAEVVVDGQDPSDERQMMTVAFSNLHRGSECDNEAEFDDRQVSWCWYTDSSDDEDGDESEDGDEIDYASDGGQ